MSDNVTETQEATVTLTVEQLERTIRKVVREELKAHVANAKTSRRCIFIEDGGQ